MIKYCLERWYKNKDTLKEHLKNDINLNNCDYLYLVKLVTEYILEDDWDSDNITVIDDGGYQGSLLFVIHYNHSTPGPGDYLMTYVDYGSCTYCDTLMGIQHSFGEEITDDQVNDFMTLCKDLVTNMVSPFNKYSDEFNEIEMNDLN